MATALTCNTFRYMRSIGLNDRHFIAVGGRPHHLAPFRQRDPLRRSKAQGLFGYGAKEQYDGRSSQQLTHDHVKERFDNAGMNTDNMKFSYR